MARGDSNFPGRECGKHRLMSAIALEPRPNVYEGTEVTGTPEVVLLRGQILVRGDELVAEPGIGQFVRRARFGEGLKSAPATTA